MIQYARQLDDLPAIARNLLAEFPEDRVFAFVGKMGAGKTTFINALCQELGVIEETGSPTFSLVNEYQGGAGDPVYHFDFYRIENPEEALDMGFEEYLESGHYNLVEWPDRVDAYLPADMILVKIVETEGQREIRADRLPLPSEG
ncbi:tRNA (adenosine(37)-N6)-threonylcarbamoyltransferase complex ATPase subunit type 1 TsaE [bacterium SCSIO 12741]|nr:tRNA (adenosine(37)-N6)-threonylcarbamoyltransferase complex ATPase subunit type 1 TsaE [bacterium SCSIO 12741]